MLKARQILPLLAVIGGLLTSWVVPAHASGSTAFATAEGVLTWIKGYRLSPEPERLPDAVMAMRKHRLLENQYKAGLQVGFTAGVLGDNPDMAEDLVRAMYPMPPKEQFLIIKAIAYSGLPNWKGLLGKFVERMPARKVLIDKYLFQGGRTLMDVPLGSDKAIIDTLWGYYIATGRPGPIRRIAEALKWSDETSNVKKVTVAMMAKWTMAANAERDPDLLNLYRRIQAGRPEPVAKPLRDVISAVQAFESERIREQAQETIEIAKRGGPPSKWASAGQIGSTALSVGCVAASALGHPEVAAPCIVTGALYSGAVKLFKLK